MHISSLLGHTQELLGIILDSKRPADSLMDTFFRSHKYLGSHDRKFIAETTYSTLRHLRKCEEHLSASLLGVEDTLLEEDRRMLLVIAYLSFEGKIEGIALESISLKLKSSRLQEHLSLLLSNLAKPVTISPDSPVHRIGVQYSFPDWMVKNIVEQYGETEAEKICSSLNIQAPLTLRVNTLKTTVEKCREELLKQGVVTEKVLLSPIGLNITKRINVFSFPAFRDGWFEVQDEGSQLLPLIIDPKPNAKLLDVCAGAGGKTLEFAAIMKNRGEIFAADINTFRLEELRKRTKRAGVQNVRVLKIEAVADLEDRYKAFFDVVFVDAPCSGLGTIRRNPGMKWMVTEQTILEVSEKQKAILHTSAPLVKPGGRLVYATCTLLKQENEEVVSSFVSSHPEYHVVDVQGMLDQWNIGNAVSGPYCRLLPHLHGTDGFFCAVLERETAR